MTTDPFSTVQSELPRDRWGRPLITPPDGGDPIAYQRVTTFVKALEDTFHLNRWAQRMVALGMTKRPDLILAASAISDPDDKYQKRQLNDIAEAAKEAAGAGAKAITGTALHRLSEKIDQGEPLANVPEAYRADVQAYRDITRGLETLAIEGFCVVDNLRIGGSYDRILAFTDTFLDAYADKHGGPLTYPSRIPNQPGRPVEPGHAAIGDLKTGNVDFGIGAIAMQLGAYAHGENYEHTLGTRTPLAGNPSKEWGLVIHLPAGTGAARLIWVDIAAGWQTARSVARHVHDWRKRKDLSHAFTSVQVAPTGGPTLVEQINAATSATKLRELFAANATRWTPGLTALAKDRVAELEGAKP